MLEGVTRTLADGRRDAVIDVAVALALGALSGALVLGLVDGTADRAVAGLLAVGHVAPLAVRRRYPLAVLAAMVATALATAPLGVPVVVLSVAWWLGDRARQARQGAERQQAEAAEAAQRVAGAERLRIARELHDVVAHAMSVIAVQAGTGRFVMDESPEVAREALVAIETTSRSALDELRRLLSVLRDDSDDGDLHPTPGLRDLDDLVAATTQAGVTVDVTVHGEVVALPSGVDLCAYRVVQEALTNVRRHARADTSAVSITYSPDCLHVVVDDDGIGSAPALSSGGHGLIGMVERVGLYGGTLDAGPRPDGGYRVAAHLPLAGQP